MQNENVKPDYYVYFQCLNSNHLMRIGRANVVRFVHYLSCTGAGLNVNSDVVRITMDDFWPDEERLLFRPLEKAIANRQFMADKYVPDFYEFWRPNSYEKQLRRIGVANYIPSKAHENTQGFDIDWEEKCIRVKQERVSSESDLILFPPTR